MDDYIANKVSELVDGAVAPGDTVHEYLQLILKSVELDDIGSLEDILDIVREYNPALSLEELECAIVDIRTQASASCDDVGAMVVPPPSPVNKRNDVNRLFGSTIMEIPKDIVFSGLDDDEDHDDDNNEPVVNKKEIVERYGLVPNHLKTTNIIFVPEGPQAPKVRYLNDRVVTVKGERFIAV